MREEPVLRQELEATLAARRELGGEMEPALLDAFVERIEQRLAERDQGRDRAAAWALEQKRNHQKEMVLGSMAISIPLLAIAAVFTGLAGVVTVCVALVVIALVTAR